jgi:hypothetical protein
MKNNHLYKLITCYTLNNKNIFFFIGYKLGVYILYLIDIYNVLLFNNDEKK